ncbi:MAG: hypothetical protein KDI19_11090 [Pseudomonadales bacterium]|nr:hypothetical protein [Pseudomonadales bacterium]
MLRYCALVILLALSFHGFGQVPARYYAARDQALIILTREDSYRAIEFIEGLGEPREVMGVFMLMSRDLYWENHNLQAALAIGRAGIHYAMSAADRLRGRPDLALELRSEAKSLAYDLSSFCWPGWNEPGIVIDDTALVLAQDLAKVNLRLALSLGKGNIPLSRAYWLIGAHHLAVDHHESARRAFVEGLKYAVAAEAKEQELLMRGYVYLSDMLKDPGNDDLDREFEFVLRDLQGTKEGDFYKQQLETARSVFIHRTGN